MAGALLQMSWRRKNKREKLRIDSPCGTSQGWRKWRSYCSGQNQMTVLLIEAINHESFEMPENKTRWQIDRHSYAMGESRGNLVTWKSPSTVWTGLPDRRRKFTKEDRFLLDFFKPVKNALLFPAVDSKRWAKKPYRPIHLSQLKKRTTSPLLPQADRRTLIRRATFDLIGLPPTPVDVENFLDRWIGPTMLLLQRLSIGY